MYLIKYLKCILHALLHSKRIQCILTFCMYFTRIPNESKIHFGIHSSDTSRYMYLGRFLGGVTLDIHVKIHQDTCILDSSSRYIRIHRDTKSRYMYLGRDTCGIQSETHTSNTYMYPVTHTTGTDCNVYRPCRLLWWCTCPVSRMWTFGFKPPATALNSSPLLDLTWLTYSTSPSPRAASRTSIDAPTASLLFPKCH